MCKNNFKNNGVTFFYYGYVYYILINLNPFKMKKVMLAFAVASIFAACNDSKTDSTTVTDSTANSSGVISTGVDTTHSTMSTDTSNVGAGVKGMDTTTVH